MILIIDNFDSFVYNLARYVRLAGADVKLVRNNALLPEECLALNPCGIILSPGPKRPVDAGICMGLLEQLTKPDSKTIPVLGVCLGHQCLVEHFGGKTVRAKRPVHGQATRIYHTGEGLFAGLAENFSAGRYHALISLLPDPPSPLVVTATSAQDEIMAVQHLTAPWFGVQFHPESVLTPDGHHIIDRFVALCAKGQGGAGQG